MKPSSISESRIQQDCVRWFKNTFCLKHHNPRSLIFSVPNEGKPELIQTGLYPGASDLVVIHRGVLMFLECKTLTGVQSDKQKSFQEHVEGMGYVYLIFRSENHFKAIISAMEATYCRLKAAEDKGA